MYVDVVINGKKARAMVDTGATHNFVTKREANKLGLKAVHSGGRMKTVNSEAQPTCGVARNVNTKIGEWSGTLDFTVATMDDFELVLGMDFLHSSKAVPMPHLGSLLVTSRQPCLLRTHTQVEEGKELKDPLLLAMQLKKGIRRNEPTFLATLSMKEEEEEGDLPEVISNMNINTAKDGPSSGSAGGMIALFPGSLLDILTSLSKGSDVIYSEEAVGDLLSTLLQLCDRHTTVILSGELRNDAILELFLESAIKDFWIGQVDQSEFHPEYSSHRVVIYILLKKLLYSIEAYPKQVVEHGSVD
uniref:Uncharacterized protein n=1 Tax=Chenopodium quinoa TaxID=63459 RepID=A0A803N0T0_CHEQI